MPEIKPGNRDWLDDLAAFPPKWKRPPFATRKELAKTLDLDRSMITFLKAVKPCFDPSAVEKIAKPHLLNQ